MTWRHAIRRKAAAVAKKKLAKEMSINVAISKLKAAGGRKDSACGENFSRQSSENGYAIKYTYLLEEGIENQSAHYRNSQ